MKKINKGEKDENDFDMKFELDIDKEFRDIGDSLHK